MDSIWLKTAQKPRFDTLNGNKKTDVLIIGGGIAGILCAYKLKNAGVSLEGRLYTVDGVKEAVIKLLGGRSK